MNILYKNLISFTARLLLLSSILVTSVNAQFWADKKPELLPEDKAFSVIAEIQDGVLRVDWSIADDYYMYRDNFRIESNATDVRIGEISFPQGTIEDDPEFGKVEVYYYNVELTASLISANPQPRTIELVVAGQGCNKPVGVCYPPMRRALEVQYQGGSADSQNAHVAKHQQKSFLAYILAAFGAGILLSFTPCVLPMIPILAGVIAGQQNPTKARSGWLAICYVAGTVVTYLAAGWVAGATGTQLQAYFQNPWVIGSICGLLLLLAASLFGWFKIQLPSGLQARLNSAQYNSRSVSISSFVLGLISALVVGACVSPILILALGAAISQGDPVLGAAIMGAMAIGMGLLLILFGFGAGWILPKAGPWMLQVQVIFGFMVIGVAIYLVDTLSIFSALYLWAGLLLSAGLYLWLLANEVRKPLGASAIKAFSIGSIVWGAMALVGGSLNGSNILNPLEPLTLTSTVENSANSDRSSLPFVTTTQLGEVTTLLEQAKQSGQPVLIDFYADWCLDCKRMHRTTFREASVIAALADWSLIEIDVTKTSDESEQAKRFFKVFGPPATLFFNANGKERQDLRQYGYLKDVDLLTILSKVKKQ